MTTTTFPYPVLSAAMKQDGTRAVFWAAQCNVGTVNGHKNTKCCVVFREPPGGKITKEDEVCRYEAIYGPPAWHIHEWDGTAIVYGKTEQGDEWRSPNVPGFVPLPSVANLLARGLKAEREE